MQATIHHVKKMVTKTVVYTFISSCLDYCNSLAYGISDVYSGVCRLCRTLQCLEAWPFRVSSNYIDYMYDNKWTSSSLPWFIRLLTAWHHSASWMTASS